jgi:MoxR-like ATPase
MTHHQALNLYGNLRDRLSQHVMGRDCDDETVSTIDLILMALVTGGHVLLEDFPGSGKSFLAEQLGRAIQYDLPSPEGSPLADFRRIQCTPDLLPTDLTGYLDASRRFNPGPVFSVVLLVDEVNRTTPKVQSALLEAMAERQVSVENETHPLGKLFFVIATQNPLDHLGTHELPAAQLDRFLFKRNLKPIAPAYEALVITQGDEGEQNRQAAKHRIEAPSIHPIPAVRASEILAIRDWCHTHTKAHPDLVDCMIQVADDIADAFGRDRVYRTSPRSSKLLYGALKVFAALSSEPSAPGPQVTTAHLCSFARDFYVHRLGLQAEELPEAAVRVEAIVRERVTAFQLQRR